MPKKDPNEALRAHEERGRNPAPEDAVKPAPVAGEASADADAEAVECGDEEEDQPAGDSDTTGVQGTTGDKVGNAEAVAQRKAQEQARKEHAVPKKLPEGFIARYGIKSFTQAELGLRGAGCTPEQVADALIKVKGFFEFKINPPEYFWEPKTKEIFIQIVGSRKGAPSFRIPESVLREVEAHFRKTFEEQGTEDRALVYLADGSTDLWVFYPEGERTRTRVFTSEPVQLNRRYNDRTWSLVADLHSHHVMGAGWSRIDNADEKQRWVVRGVFSWRGGDVWLFREWGPDGYTSYAPEEVIAYGE